MRTACLACWVGALLLFGTACGEDESPETYIQRFSSMDEAVRTRAGNELMRFEADQVVPLLIESANHELVRVRFEAMRMLGRFQDDRGVPTLIKALDDKSPRVAAMAAASLALLRAEQALPHLLKHARAPSPVVRRYVIAALGPCHSSATQPALTDSAHREVLRALESPKPDLRIAALESIREFGYRGAASQLVEMAEDPSPEVRHVAVQAVGELGAGGEGGERRRVPRDPITEPSSAMRDSIVTALLNRLDPDEYQSVRTKAIRALGEMEARRAIPALRSLTDTGTDDDQREARRALGAIEPAVSGGTDQP